MAQSDKLLLADLAKETGTMTLNQINEMFGIEPFDGGNRRIQSLNYVSSELIDKYQLSKSKSDSNDVDKDDGGIKSE